MRVVENARRMLFGAGVVLLSFCALAYASGRFEARMAVTRFKAELLQPELSHVSAQGTGSNINTTLWSDKLIQGHEASLAKGFEPPLAMLRLPRMRLEVPVYNGTDGKTLNRGVGRINGTARPGEEGNIGIAGHRDGFFRPLKDITLADTVQLMTKSGVRSYVVDSLRIVSPDDVTVLRSGDTPAVTLVTCYPFYFIGSAPKRFVVHASLRVTDRNSMAHPVQVSSTSNNVNSQENSK